MNDSASRETFDYDSLDEATRQFVLQKTNETHGLLKRTAEHIIQIGQNLQEVQQRLPDMKFSAWLRAEFMFSRQSAYNFMRVAKKFAGSCKTILQLPATVLYELASSSDDIIQQVEKGELPASLEAIKAAKEAERQAREAERQARAEMDRTQQHLLVLQEAAQTQQATIRQLTHDLAALQEHLTIQETANEQQQAGKKLVIPPEITTQMHALQQQLTTLTQQRDELSQQVRTLQEEARTAALEHLEGEQERRIRLNWYKITNEFQRSIRTLLSQWPSPLDVLAFEADDWNRLAQTKELARRFLKECMALTTNTEEKIIDVAAVLEQEASEHR